ncbi:MAG: hypothetical protein ACFFB5_07505 [Promethearchaeota archaeon]
MFVSVQTTEINYSLPTKGTKTYPMNLKKDWYYDFEVITWSGDETINISILRGEEVIFSALLVGEELEYEMDPDSPAFYYPALGEGFQVEESGNYTLVTQVIVEPTQGPTYLRLYCRNQRVLGFDAGILVIPWLITVICGFFALVGSFFFGLYQTIRQKREWPMLFSFETKKSSSQTKIVVSSPINKSYVPRIVSPIIVIAFFFFFITELISAFQHNFSFTLGLGVSTVGIIFTTLVCVILLSRFVIIVKNDKIYVGREFWKFNRFKTISKYQITNIRWDMLGHTPEYYPFLIIETSIQKYQFQPLGTSITQSQPRPEMQQFLDSFLQELNDVIMK